MLSIGEFSKICNVSTKTLRYYAEIDLLLPSVINPENGYRYYAIEQLKTMLFINRLKGYNFSLEDIKKIVKAQGQEDDGLYVGLYKKKMEFVKQIQMNEKLLLQIEEDLDSLQKGKSMMSYMEDIHVQLVEVDKMNLLSVRELVMKANFPRSYQVNFQTLLQRVRTQHLTMIGAPMVLFHSTQFEDEGMDSEFAIPIGEYVTGTRDFAPGLCLKTVLYGAYEGLSSIYVRQMEWAQQHGYENTGALFEVYVVDPSFVSNESELITEVYYPIRKR